MNHADARSPTLVLALAAALAMAAAPDAHAQFRRPDVGPAPGQGWAPASVGIHGGYDYSGRASVLGAQARLPLIPGGLVELVPNGSVTFLTGLKEYQGGVDLVAVSGGRRGGLYAGAGVAWRNTLWEGGERETRRAPTVVVGVQTRASASVPFATQLEMRWTYPEGVFRPRVLSLGVNFPLWGRTR